MIYLGIIKEVKESSVRVQYGNTLSDFLPFLLPFSSFKKHLSPPQVGQKVVLFKLDESVGFVLGSLCDKDTTLDPKEEKIIFEDKLILSYKEGILKIEGSDEVSIQSKKAKILEADEVSIQSKKVEILEADEVSIKEAKEVKIQAQTTTLKAQSVTIESEDINLGGSGGLGVVTGACLCPFTGASHADTSLKVKATK